jgi:hypothetical protein
VLNLPTVLGGLSIDTRKQHIACEAVNEQSPPSSTPSRCLTSMWMPIKDTNTADLDAASRPILTTRPVPGVLGRLLSLPAPTLFSLPLPLPLLPNAGGRPLPTTPCGLPPLSRPRGASQVDAAVGARVRHGAYGSMSMQLTSSMRSVSLRNTGGPP